MNNNIVVSNIDIDINNFIPKKYYPLVGIIIIKNKNNIILFEECIINNDRSAMLIKVEGDNQYLYELGKRINFTDIYSYEFILKKRIALKDKDINNVYIKGVGKFYSPYEINLNITSNSTIHFQPLYFYSLDELTNNPNIEMW